MIKDNYNKKLDFRLTEKDFNLLHDYCRKYGITYTKFFTMLLEQFFIERSKGEKQNENK